MSAPTIRRPVTMLDIASATGLSRTTVSVALSGNGRLSQSVTETVRRAAQELGYEADYYAQALRKPNNDLIGYFSPGLDLGISTMLVQAITQRLFALNLTVQVNAYGCREGGEFREQDVLLRNLRRQKPRAMICNNSNLQAKTTQDELRRYLAEGGMAVCYDMPLEVEADMVLFDREENLYRVTRYLLEKGHRKLGCYLPTSEQPISPWVKGFLRALGEFGAMARPEWCFPWAFQLENELEGVVLAEKFLALPERPTAMCIVNDRVALGFAATLNRNGIRIPHDLSIIGHDNAAVAEHGFLPLTTISYPLDRVADAVVDMLQSRLTQEYNGPPRREAFHGNLIERDTVCSLAP